MLVLNENHLNQAVTMNELITAIEEAYILYERNDFSMPIRNQISDHENTLLLMPCVAIGSTITKIVSVFPNNREHPVTQGIVVLTERSNGTTKAVLNGTILTGLKTGAVGGAAMKYLARPHAQTVGLIGTGFQGLYQLLAACAVRDIKQIFLYNRTPSKISSFVQLLLKHLTKEVEIHAVEDSLELVEKSEIIITSTTSQSPVLPDHESIYNGKLIIGIGSYQPQMREFSQSVYSNLDALYIDTLDAMEESGDIIDAIQNQWIDQRQVISFSKIVTEKIKPDLTDVRPIVFKSTGMALFDLVVAEAIYEKAIQQKIGQFVNF